LKKIYSDRQSLSCGITLFKDLKKTFMKISAAILIFICVSLNTLAQQPSPDPDTLKNPVKQIDPEVKQAPADIHYVDEMVRISAAELPQPVLDSLKKAEPATWEKSVVYKDKLANSFLVQIRDGGEEKTYRFDKQGNRLKNLDAGDERKTEGQ
jgi:hypothetical protein